MLINTAVFLILNFSALGLGGVLMGQGPSSEWYLKLQKAPWTPPGWVFSVAWILVMICFALYMTHLWEVADNHRELMILFVFQWVLNIAWNPVFFRYQQVLAGLAIIVLLTILVGYFLFYYLTVMGSNSIFILPYLIWLMVAISLNAYILLRN